MKNIKNTEVNKFQNIIVNERVMTKTRSKVLLNSEANNCRLENIDGTRVNNEVDMKKTKTLVVIAGVSGEIGTNYAKRLIDEGCDVVGISRRTKVEGVSSSKFTQVYCDLSDERSVQDSCGKIQIESYDRVILLHTIGIDKFNPRNYPLITKIQTIDPEIYEANVNSFKYILRYIAGRINKANESGTNIKMKTAIIAGVSDKHTPFVIEDFCEAKLILRGYLHSFTELFPEWFTGLSINITSTITKSALLGRPYADTSYWLAPIEVVNSSVKELLASEKMYKEVDIIKFSNDYVEGYYDNHHALYQKWSRETGIKSSVLSV